MDAYQISQNIRLLCFLKNAFTDKKNLKTFLTLNIYFINQSVLFSTRPSALKKAKTVTNNSFEKGM